MSDFSEAREQIVGQLKKEMRDLMLAVVSQTRSAAQARSPVRTGHLRSSWRGRSSTFKGTVRNTAYYAQFVEYGTSKQRSQPMIEPLIPIVEGEMSRSISTGTPFNLGQSGYVDPVDELRRNYQERYGNYGSQRGYSG